MRLGNLLLCTVLTGTLAACTAAPDDAGSGSDTQSTSAVSTAAPSSSTGSSTPDDSATNSSSTAAGRTSSSGGPVAPSSSTAAPSTPVKRSGVASPTSAPAGTYKVEVKGSGEVKVDLVGVKGGNRSFSASLPYRVSFPVDSEDERSVGVVALDATIRSCTVIYPDGRTENYPVDAVGCGITISSEGSGR